MEKPDDKKLQLSNSIFQSLDTTVYWAKFLAVMGFIGIGFMVISAFFMMTVDLNSPLAGNFLGIAFLYILFAFLYFFPVNYLYKFANTKA
jgi:hypothetical protein